MGTTPRFQLPYPEPTDPVADGATAIEALAEAVEARMSTNRAVGAFVNGGAQLAIAAGQFGNTFQSSLAVPAGRWFLEIYYQQFVSMAAGVTADLLIRSTTDNLSYSSVRIESHVGGGGGSCMYRLVVNGGSTAYWYTSVQAIGGAVNTWVDPAQNLFNIIAIPYQ